MSSDSKEYEIQMHKQTVCMCFYVTGSALSGWCSLTVKKVLEMVNIWTHSEPGWSLLRETWSCSVTAWQPTLTSKVTCQWLIKHWLPNSRWPHKLITNVDNEIKLHCALIFTLFLPNTVKFYLFKPLKMVKIIPIKQPEKVRNLSEQLTDMNSAMRLFDIKA